MLKSRMHRTRVDMVRPSQLPDSPKTLEIWMVYDFSFPGIELNESMNRTPKLKQLIRASSHRSTPLPGSSQSQS